MSRYADQTQCPDCRATLPPAPASCPRCALPLQGPAAAALLRVLVEADDRLAALRASAAVHDDPVAHLSTAQPDAQPDLGHGPRRRGLRGASVPRILLGLGALCLLVAAVTFLAVAWSWLGVGGRTGVLLALTAAAAVGGLRLAGRGLRVGAESFTTVALGLLALDVVGAERAGWLGDLPGAGVAGAVGVALLVGGAMLALAGRVPAPGPDGPEGVADRARLTAPQLLAGTGLALATLGWTDVATLSAPVSSSASILLAAGLAALAGRAGLRVLRRTALVVASGWWLLLATSALVLGADRASLATWWGDSHAPALLEAAGWAALLLVLPRAPRWARTAALSTAATLLTLVVLVPLVDEDATVAVLACLAAVVVWTCAVVAVPRWRGALAAPQMLAALPTLPFAVEVVAAALVNVLEAGPASARSAGVVLAGTDTALGPLLLPVVLVLTLAVAAHRRDRSGAVLVAGAGVLAALVTLAAGAVPLWTVVAAVATAGAAVVVLGCTGRVAAPVERAGAAVGTVLLLGASAAALPSVGLTTVALGVLVTSAALLAVRSVDATVGSAAWAVLPAGSGALVWSACGVLDVGLDLRALPVLLVVGALALARPRPAAELSAAVVGALACLVALDAAEVATGSLSTPLALHLTVAGVLVAASALLHAHRRGVGWLGGLLLVAATWVRLADLGVSAPEAYTLPSALALLVLGLVRLRRDPAASTRTSLRAGLVLGLVPTLLWVLATDLLSARAVLLGAACLVLVLGGAWRRWSAPLVVGALVGGVLVLAELAPYAGRTPSWLLIALAGALLSGVGVTWEARTGDVRRAAGYLARLR